MTWYYSSKRKCSWQDRKRLSSRTFMLAVSVSQSKSELIAFIKINKEIHKRRSKCFRSFHNARQNEWLPGRADLSRLQQDWWLRVWLKSLPRGSSPSLCAKLWPVIDWSSAYSDSTGGRAVKNPKTGRRESVGLLKHRCVNWQMYIGCKYESQNSFNPRANISRTKKIICHCSLFRLQPTSEHKE